MVDKEKLRKVLKVYGDKCHELRTVLGKWMQKENVADSFLEIEVPTRVFIEPTNRCNLKCTYCAHTVMGRDNISMDIEKYKQIVDCLPDGSYITVTGNGEPLLNIHIYDMLTYAIKKGFEVGVFTNGSLLTDNNSRKLLKTGVKRVQISFDTVNKKVFDKVQGGSNSFERNLYKILRFLYIARKESKSNVFITLSSVLTKEVKKYNRKSKIFWNLMPIDNYYEGELLSLQQDSQLYSEIDFDENEEWKVCVNPWIVLKFNADGSVNACPMDFSSKYSIGNINEQNAREIMNSEKAIRLRRALYEKDIGFLSEIGYDCHKCNAWRTGIDHNIEDYLNSTMPITTGLVLNEISNERCYSLGNLERLISDYSLDKVEELTKN